MDQFYYESGYIDASYFVYTADAAAAVSASAGISCDATKIVGGVTVNAFGNWTSTCAMSTDANRVTDTSVSLTSTFTQSAMISDIRGVDIFAFSDAAISTTVSRIRDNNIALSGTFNVATSVNRIRIYSSDDAAAFGIVADNLRVRYEDAALSAAFSMSADLTRKPGVTVEAIGNWTAQFSSTANNNRISQIQSDLSVNASIAANNNRIREDQIVLSTQFNSTTDIHVIKSTAVSVSASATVYIPGERIVQCQSLEYTAFTSSIVCRATKNSFAVLTTTAGLNATATSAKFAAASLSSSATIVADVKKQTALIASLSSSATVVSNGLLINRRPHGSTVVGTPSFSTSVKQLGTHSVLFPIGSYINVNSTPNFNFDANQDFSISFFFRPISATGGVNTLAQYVVGSQIIWDIQYTSTYTVFRYYNGTAIQTYSFSNISLNNWNFIHIYRSYGNRLCYEIHTYNGSTWSVAGNDDGFGYRTYGGAISGSGYGTLKIGSITGSSHSVYIDEFFIAKNDNGINTLGGYYTRPAANLTVGANSTTELLYHFDNNYLDDIHGVVNASADLTSTATVVATGNIPTIHASAALTSSATQTTTAVKTTNTSANLLVQGFEVATTGRIRPEVAGLSSQFGVNAQVGKLTQTSAALQSTATLTADYLSLGLAQANLSSSASLGATLRARYLGGVANLQSTASISPAPNVLTGTAVGTAHGGITLSFNFTIASGSNAVTITLPIGPSVPNIAPENFFIVIGLNDTYGQYAGWETYINGNSNYYNISYNGLDSDFNTGLNLVRNQSYTCTFQLTSPTPTNGTVGHSGSLNNASWTINGTNINSHLIAVSGPDRTESIHVNSKVTLPSKLLAPLSGTYSASGGTVSNVSISYPSSYDIYSVYAYGNINANFNTTALGYRVALSSAALNTAFTQTATILRIKSSSANLSSQFTQTVVARKAVTLQSNLNSAAILTESLISRIRPSGGVLAAAFAQLTQAIKATVALANWSSAFAQSTTPKYYKGSAVALSAQFAQTTTARKTASARSNIQAMAADITVVNRIGRGFIHAATTATLSANVSVTSGSVVHLNAQAMTSATGYNVQFGRAALTTAAQLATQPTYLRHTESLMQASATLVTRNSRSRGTTSGMVTTASVIANTGNSRIRSTAANVQTTASLNIQNQILRRTTANLQSEASIPFALGGVMVRFEANLQMQGFEVAIIDVLHIDPYYQIQIRPESRLYLIESETRIRVVKSESRVNKIIGRIR